MSKKLSSKMCAAIAAGVVSASLTNAAFAQQPASSPMPGMKMGKESPSGKNPSSQAFMQGRSDMMQHMDVPLTGDADKDFIAGMIPHHQGAIEMAKIELKYGKDPQARKMAENIVAEQKKEIVEMKKWQEKRGVK